MDPMYFTTGIFRLESDVFSMGVTMLRTLTAEDATKEHFRDDVEDAYETGTEEAIWRELDEYMYDRPPLDIVMDVLKLTLACYNSNRQDRRPPLTQGIPTRAKHDPIVDTLRNCLARLDVWEESQVSMRKSVVTM